MISGGPGQHNGATWQVGHGGKGDLGALMQWDALGIVPGRGCAAQEEGMKVHLWLCLAPPCPDATLETRATEYLGL